MGKKQHTWLLIRGLIREKRHWGQFPQTLQKRFPQDDILTIDLPGNGSLNNQESPTDIDSYACYLHNILNEYKFNNSPRSITVVAVSLGAMVALKWQELFPSDFHRLIMINTSLRKVNPLFRRLRPQNILKFIKIFLSHSYEKRESQILEIVSNNSTIRKLNAPLWANIQRDRPVSRRNALRQLIAAATFKPPEHSPSVKTILLASTEDQLAHWQCSAQIAHNWNLPLFIHKTAGHDLCLDDPEWVLRHLELFITEQTDLRAAC